ALEVADPIRPTRWHSYVYEEDWNDAKRRKLWPKLAPELTTLGVIPVLLINVAVPARRSDGISDFQRDEVVRRERRRVNTVDDLRRYVVLIDLHAVRVQELQHAREGSRSLAAVTRGKAGLDGDLGPELHGEEQTVSAVGRENLNARDALVVLEKS